MIGGEDIVLPTLTLDRAIAMDVCTRAIVRRWPGAVIQSGTTAEIYPRYQSVPFADEREIMIYRDQEALDSWNKLESHPDNRNTMVHLLAYGDEHVTLVVDDAQVAGMQSLLQEMRRAIWNAPARMGSDAKKRAA